MLKVRYGFIALILAVLATGAFSGPKVTVVLGPEAPALEKTAAAELAGQLTRLYQAEIATATAVPAQAESVILVGSPATNPAIPGENWPKLSDQGHIVKSLPRDGKPSLVIGGGSPAATYWAVAEHGYRLGIRSFTFGDLDPISPPEFHLDGWDVVMEPRLKVRGFTTLAPDAIGLSMWGLEEQKKLIQQLAKLKFNRIVVHLEPWYPVVDWEYKGAKRSQGWFSLKEPLVIDSETLGRGAFKGQKEFDNPDLVGKATWKERVAAGQALVRGIVEEAKAYGMQTCLSMDPFSFPVEVLRELPPVFRSELQDTGVSRAFVDIPELSNHVMQSPAVGLAKATTRQLDSFEAIEVRVPDTYEIRPLNPKDLVREAWKRLATLHEEQPRFDRDDVLTQSLSAAIVWMDGVAPLREVLTQNGRNPDAPRDLSVNLDGTASDLLDQVILPGAGYCARTQLPLKDSFKFPVPQVRENVRCISVTPSGRILPSMHVTELSESIDRMVDYGWDGFTLVAHQPGDAERELHLANRAAFFGNVEPKDALDELINPVCGDGVAISVKKGFDWIERAQDQDPITRAASYAQATNELYRANTRSREGGRQFTLYFARRFEFASAYATAVDTVERASKLTDKDARAAEMEKALDSFHAAGVSMAAMARSSSDRAIIAALNRDPRLKQAREALEALDE